MQWRNDLKKGGFGTLTFSYVRNDLKLHTHKSNLLGLGLIYNCSYTDHRDFSISGGQAVNHSLCLCSQAEYIPKSWVTSCGQIFIKQGSKALKSLLCSPPMHLIYEHLHNKRKGQEYYTSLSALQQRAKYFHKITATIRRLSPCSLAGLVGYRLIHHFLQSTCFF